MAQIQIQRHITDTRAFFKKHITPNRSIAACFGLLALLLNTHDVGTTSVWYDEAWSYALSNQSLHTMYYYIWGPFQNMALYYVLLHFWLHFLQFMQIHPTELLLRLPSVLAASAGTAIVYLFGARFFSRTAGIVAASVTLADSLQLYGAQQARAYGLQMLLLVCAWYALFSAFSALAESHRNRWWLAYAVLMALAINTHLFSIMVWAAQLAVIGVVLVAPGQWRDRTRASLRVIAASMVLISVSIVPIIYASKKFGGASTWIPIPKLSDIYNFVLVPLTNFNTTFSVVLTLLVGVALLIPLLAPVPALQTLIQRPSPTIAQAPTGDLDATLKRAVVHAQAAELPDRKFQVFRDPQLGVWLIACWFVIPIVLSFVLSLPLINLHLFYRRYLMVCVPPMAILAGIGVAVLRPLIPRIALAIVVIFLGAMTIPSFYSESQLADFRTTTQWVQAHYQPGDGVACYPVLACSLGVNYYFEVYPGPAHFDANSPGIWNWPAYTAVYDPANPVTPLIPYSTTHKRVFLFYGPINLVPGSIEDNSFHAAQQWLQTHGTFIASYQSQIDSVYLYDMP